MLSDERILAIATEFNYDARHWIDPKHKDATRDVFLRAIRLAVAETAEACAKECARMASDAFALGKTMRSARAALDAQGRAHMDAAAAIREKARTE